MAPVPWDMALSGRLGLEGVGDGEPRESGDDDLEAAAGGVADRVSGGAVTVVVPIGSLNPRPGRRPRRRRHLAHRCRPAACRLRLPTLPPRG